MGLVFADFGYQPVGLACGLASVLAALVFRVQRRQQGS
jgi:predicted MFS family arabinose efflux permease